MRPQNAVLLIVVLVLPLPIASAQAPQSSLSTEVGEQTPDKRIAEMVRLGRRALSLANEGNFQAAIEGLHRVYSIQEEIHGKPHEDLLLTLDLIARFCVAAQDYKSALVHRQRALEIGKALYSEKDFRLTDLQRAERDASLHLDLDQNQREILVEARSLEARMLQFFRQGNIAEARELGNRIPELYRKVLGEEHPDYATSLNNLARLHQSMDEYSRAEPLYSQTLEIRKRILGEEHPDYADSLSDLAWLYLQMNDFMRAEPLASQALEIRKLILGEEHPEYAHTLHILARLYHQMGDYTRAEPLYSQTLEIRKRILGEEHPDYANSLSDLAWLHESMGEYSRAEPLYSQALEIRKRNLGEEHPDYATSLNNLARLHQSMGEYSRAEPLYSQALEIRKRNLGEEHPDYATSLNNLARLHQSMGEYSRAEPLYSQALEIRKRILGEEHPDYAHSLSDLAWLYLQMNDFMRAEPLALQALEIRKLILGEEHPEYAHSLKILARLYHQMGEYARAEPLYSQTLEIRKRILGEEHPDYADSLSDLAWLYLQMNDFMRAEPLASQALEIRKLILGEEHPDYANSLNILAKLYQQMGDFTRAEPLATQALEIRKRILGEEHPEYANSLCDLAWLYLQMNDFMRAEPLASQALEIHKRILGEEHPDYANSLNTLAGLYASMGDYARAEPLNAQALEIRKRVLGEEHPNYAGSLHNLAMLYASMGEYTRAERLYSQALEILKRVLGEDHPDYAICLNNLAGLYILTDDYARAEPLIAQALEINKRVLGEEHPDHVKSLNTLAGLYASMREYKRAEPLVSQALEIHKQTLGEVHPDFALYLINLAGLYASMGEYTRAEPVFHQALNISFEHLYSTSMVLSEQQQLLMGETLRYQLDLYLKACIEGGLPQQDAIERVVAWKGATMVRQRRLRQAAEDPAVAETFRELQSITQRFAAICQQLPAPENLERWKIQLKELTEQKQKLEIELMRRSKAFRKAKHQVTLDEIENSLPENSVLIDYLEYAGKDGPALLASVIRADADPVLVDLGSAEKAGQLIDRWRKSYGTEDAAKLAGQKLRSQLWEPLLSHVADRDLILVSTDGVLGRLPFAALPGSAPGTYLIEDHRMVTIPVPQLLPALVGEDPPRLKREFLLMGDIDYKTAVKTESDAVQKATPRRKRPFERRVLPSEGRGETTWRELKETGYEVEFISGMYQRLFQPDKDSVIDLRKGQATESAFREFAPQSMFVHLATHGFFAAAEVPSAVSVKQIAQRERHSGSMFGEHQDVVRGFSPGQLSGLVFAGANDPHDFDPLTEDPPEDGILTADEIAFLPMNGVRLVVLSACQTGLGEVAGGEGLLGIQRAFQISGARSTVASLWKVSDPATRRLMQEFYTNYLEEEMSVLDALREAQLWALNHPSDVPRGDPMMVYSSEETARLSPQFWAAFTLSGDWR